MRPDLVLGLVTVLVIGIIIGVAFDRLAGPSWFARQIAGMARSIVTSALVGVAGAFIGFHLAGILGLSSIALLVGAGIGAIAVLYGWRMVR